MSSILLKDLGWIRSHHGPSHTAVPVRTAAWWPGRVRHATSARGLRVMLIAACYRPCASTPGKCRESRRRSQFEWMFIRFFTNFTGLSVNCKPRAIDMVSVPAEEPTTFISDLQSGCRLAPSAPDISRPIRRLDVLYHQLHCYRAYIKGNTGLLLLINKTIFGGNEAVSCFR